MCQSVPYLRGALEVSQSLMGELIQPLLGLAGFVWLRASGLLCLRDRGDGGGGGVNHTEPLVWLPHGLQRSAIQPETNARRKTTNHKTSLPAIPLYFQIKGHTHTRAPPDTPSSAGGGLTEPPSPHRTWGQRSVLDRMLPREGQPLPARPLLGRGSQQHLTLLGHRLSCSSCRGLAPTPWPRPAL